MSLPRSREGFTYFEITRPVEDGPALRRFLSQARQLGATVLAPEISAVMTEEELAAGEDDALNGGGKGYETTAGRITGVRTSRLRVYEAEDMRYALLHYRIAPGIKYGGTFNRAAQRVNRDLQRPDGNGVHPDNPAAGYQREAGKGKRRPKGELFRQLQRHGLQYDIMSPEDPLSISFDHVSLFGDPDLPFTELALAPGAHQPVTRMLVEQGRICFNRFHGYSLEAATVVGGIDHSIPFARLPADVTDMEQAALVMALAKLLPVRLVLGGTQSRHSIAQH